MSVAAALCLVPVVATVVVAAMHRHDAGDPTDRGALALVVASPVVMWLAATLVQATTQKVRVETIRVGYVYNYYAYGSVGVVLAALLAVRCSRGGISSGARGRCSSPLRSCSWSRSRS
jgi:hypothetical protein